MINIAFEKVLCIEKSIKTLGFFQVLTFFIYFMIFLQGILSALSQKIWEKEYTVEQSISGEKKS
jgi:hypothetical protein